MMNHRPVVAVAAAVLISSPSWSATEPVESDAMEVVATGKRLSEATIAIGTDQPTATVSITREALLSAPAGSPA